MWTTLNIVKNIQLSDSVISAKAIEVGWHFATAFIAQNAEFLCTLSIIKLLFHFHSYHVSLTIAPIRWEISATF